MRVKQGRTFIGRLPHNGDLLGSLTDICEKEKITLGVFSVIGAVKSANLGYYKQDEKKYTTCVDLVNTKLEINACIGNISMNDGKVFVHAHVTFAAHDGACYGGHLMPGARVFAAEYYIQELSGGDLIREHDPETGLRLWKV